MLKLFIISLVFTVNVFGRWHCSSHPPKEGQMFMFEMRGVANPYHTNLLMISHYKPWMRHRINAKGWYDVNMFEMWAWIKLGYRIYYIPNENIEGDGPCIR